MDTWQAYVICEWFNRSVGWLVSKLDMLDKLNFASQLDSVQDSIESIVLQDTKETVSTTLLNVS